MILIDTRLPEDCFSCGLSHPAFSRCLSCALTGSTITAELAERKRLENCPLIELPPHGRLIDADALQKLFEDQWLYLQVLDWNENPTAEAKQNGINWCINTMHDDAPTVIPAELETEVAQRD